MMMTRQRTTRTRPAALEFREEPKLPRVERVEHRLMPGIANPESKALPHIEHRFAGLDDLAVTIKDGAEGRRLEGYGCRFGVRDSYDTVFERGCFADSIAEWRTLGQWPSFYLQHDWDCIVGGWDELFEDTRGLVVRGDFLQSMWGDHARALVLEKRARGLSIGFVAVEWRVETDASGREIRYITKADLWEISLVERPAVPGSAVTAIRADMSVREVEGVLTSLGAPAKAAKAMVAGWKPKGEARDAQPDDTEQRDAAEKAKAEAQAREARAKAQADVNRELIIGLQGAARALKP